MAAPNPKGEAVRLPVPPVDPADGPPEPPVTSPTPSLGNRGKSTNPKRVAPTGAAPTVSQIGVSAPATDATSPEATSLGKVRRPSSKSSPPRTKGK